MKCPFCGAEIAENSRFCLYCMKSLDEKEIISVYKKKKWWLIVLTAILLLCLISFGVWFLKDNDKNAPTENNNDIVVNEESLSEDNDEEASDDESKKPTEEQTSSTEKIENEILSSTDSEDFKTVTTTIPVVQSEKIENVTWYYRSAYSSDYDKRYNKIEISDAITIIGFKNIPSNGIFKIPETIDGKTVVSIDMNSSKGYSFNDVAVSGKVKKVYLPSKLNRVETGTFSKCINMTDLYVAGEYLYIDPMSFPEKKQRIGKLTIHSTDNSWCLYGSKYFNVYCSQYGPNEYYASWKEWNGII